MLFNMKQLKPALSPLCRNLGLFQGTCPAPCISAAWLFFPHYQGMNQAASQLWIELEEVNHLAKSSSNAHPFRLVYFWISPKNTELDWLGSGNLFMSAGGLEALAKARFMPKPNKPQGYQFRAVVTSQSQIFLKLLIRTFKACLFSPAES